MPATSSEQGSGIEQTIRLHSGRLRSTFEQLVARQTWLCGLLGGGAAWGFRQIDRCLCGGMRTHSGLAYVFAKESLSHEHRKAMIKLAESELLDVIGISLKGSEPEFDIALRRLGRVRKFSEYRFATSEAGLPLLIPPAGGATLVLSPLRILPLI